MRRSSSGGGAGHRQCRSGSRGPSICKVVFDLYNLLSIAFEYPADEIGGWKIGTAPVSGTRIDAARTLHTLADSARRRLVVADAGVPADRLIALIRAFVASPSPDS